MYSFRDCGTASELNFFLKPKWTCCNFSSNILIAEYRALSSANGLILIFNLHSNVRNYSEAVKPAILKDTLFFSICHKICNGKWFSSFILRKHKRTLKCQCSYPMYECPVNVVRVLPLSKVFTLMTWYFFERLNWRQSLDSRVKQNSSRRFSFNIWDDRVFSCEV